MVRNEYGYQPQSALIETQISRKPESVEYHILSEQQKKYFTKLDIKDSWKCDTILNKITSIREKYGLDYSANNIMLQNAIQDIRRVRGIVVASFITDPLVQAVEKIHPLPINERLALDDINPLFQHVAHFAEKIGGLYWDPQLTRNIESGNLQKEDMEPLFREKDSIVKKTAPIEDPNLYQEYSNDIVSTLDYVFKWNQDTRPIPEKLLSLGNDLGDHFGQHSYLKGIDINQLRTFTDQSQGNVIVLVANASSGIIEAGIVAYYMNTFLHIPTVIDPIIFSKSSTRSLVVSQKETEGMDDDAIASAIRQGKHFKEEKKTDLSRWVKFDPQLFPIKKFISSNTFGRTKKQTLAIPFDDTILGVGTSMKVAYNEALTKYGKDQLLLGTYPKKSLRIA
ncbi:MAG: hypothetical protein UT30_C0009G0017 [Candidatus Uhrbacteria bacterium GW2011_GWF2_39_13]|uniref:Uncharacterized protein n=1 Tax=Candidatus Uhrbacteria bacterium GW2011_GWF2_39_13 TaxID=1618995 RepID=A0A0G0QRQ3_9BACT|nr:MAG: hypothetical protein UT30_C0009G0017 [Candidatus Uhrbacteria bacterium GW2011_GWF2_39_13]HAU65754.1 hypothetical protein [Candidatus Uhrbacteria bacterium]